MGGKVSPTAPDNEEPSNPSFTMSTWHVMTAQLFWLTRCSWWLSELWGGGVGWGPAPNPVTRRGRDPWKKRWIIKWSSILWDCDKCGKQFRTKDVRWSLRLQIEPSWPPSVWLYCPALLAQPPWPLKLYYSTTHRIMENLYYCTLCGEGFASRNNLTRHMNSHAEENWNHCAVCGEEFVSWNRLKRHIKDSYWR